MIYHAREEWCEGCVSIVKTRHTATSPSSGGSLHPKRYVYCSPPLQHGTPPTSGTMPCLLPDRPVDGTTDLLV